MSVVMWQLTLFSLIGTPTTVTVFDHPYRSEADCLQDAQASENYVGICTPIAAVTS